MLAAQYPLPFMPDAENPLGLPLSVRVFDPPVRHFTHGIYRIDGVRVATLERGVDPAVADRMIEAINQVGNLRPDWNFECINQIPLIIQNAARFLHAFQKFCSHLNPEVAAVQRRLRLNVPGGWMKQTEDFIATLKEPAAANLNPILEGQFKHAVFQAVKGRVPKASRIWCKMEGVKKPQTVFIVEGYDEACPHAQKLYGATLAETLQVFLDVNAANSILPARFVRMVAALRVAVPEMLRRIGTIEVTGVANLQKHEPLQDIKYYALELQKSFYAFSKPVDRIAYTLQSAMHVDIACRFYEDIMARNWEYISVSNNLASYPISFRKGAVARPLVLG